MFKFTYDFPKHQLLTWRRLWRQTQVTVLFTGMDPLPQILRLLVRFFDHLYFNDAL